MSDICTVKKSTLDGIAEAIQSKTGESGGMLPSEMAGKILSIPSVPEIPDMEHYEIIADTAMTNGAETQEWFKSLIAEHEDTAPYWLVFLSYAGTTPVNRQLLGWLAMSNQTPSNMPNILYSPWRFQAGGYTKTNAQASYDTFVNVGDKYILTLVKPTILGGAQMLFANNLLTQEEYEADNPEEGDEYGEK